MRLPIGLAVALLLCGCARKPESAASLDTLTTRERQEAVGRSGLPGAHGINRALEIVDTAQARARALDTVGQ
jgi:hypothetical protein